MSEEYPKNERCFTLLGAIQRFRGLSRAQAREKVPAYSVYCNEGTFQRTFERDIAALRSYGYPIKEEKGIYFYDETAPVISSLSSLDVGLLASALSQVNKDNHPRGKASLIGVAKSGITKLLADNFSSDRSPRYLKACIPSGEEAPTIAAALQARRRISFDYRTPTLRRYEMEPSHLSVHFGIFYVTGWARPLSSSAQETKETHLLVPPGASTEKVSSQCNPSQAHDCPAPQAHVQEAATYAKNMADNTEETNLVPWKKRTFRIPRIISGSVKNVGDALLAPPDIDTSVFLAPQAIIAVKPGMTIPPFIAHAVPCASPTGTPDGWTCVELQSVNRHRLFEFLVDYAPSVRLVGDAELLNDWYARLTHLSSLEVPS